MHLFSMAGRRHVPGGEPNTPHCVWQHWSVKSWEPTSPSAAFRSLPEPLRRLPGHGPAIRLMAVDVDHFGQHATLGCGTRLGLVQLALACGVIRSAVTVHIGVAPCLPRLARRAEPSGVGVRRHGRHARRGGVLPAAAGRAVAVVRVGSEAGVGVVPPVRVLVRRCPPRPGLKSLRRSSGFPLHRARDCGPPRRGHGRHRLKVPRRPAAVRPVDDKSGLRRPLEPPAPRRVAAESRCVANDDQATAGSRDHDVETAPVRQEAHVAVAVAAHSAEDDQLLLSALEGINRGYLQRPSAAPALQTTGQVHAGALQSSR
mmetsp:Transcript_88058/g.275754  ORF Transcript_88058/g.275754 Transcript_88058/m.275754 type:complete len:315 (-) Transcript_88058:1529-2473(-)